MPKAPGEPVVGLLSAKPVGVPKPELLGVDGCAKAATGATGLVGVDGVPNGAAGLGKPKPEGVPNAGADA